jgi:hypothetical protein
MVIQVAATVTVAGRAADGVDLVTGGAPFS